MVARETSKIAAKSETEYPPVSYMRRSFRLYLVDSFGCLPLVRAMCPRVYACGPPYAQAGR